MEPSSELSVLESPKKGLGRPPNKKPRYLTNEQRKEKEDREKAQRLEAERERRVAEAAEAKRREVELKEAEKKIYATAFRGLKEAGFSTTYDFLRGAFTTSDVATSSAMGRLLQTHGEDFLNVLAKKNPELADDWAQDRTLKMYQEEARRLWKVFRPTAGTDKLSLITEFSLEELMDRMDAVAPHLINLLLAIGLPPKTADATGDTNGEGSSARRRDSRLVSFRECGTAGNRPLTPRTGHMYNLIYARPIIFRTEQRISNLDGPLSTRLWDATSAVRRSGTCGSLRLVLDSSRTPQATFQGWTSKGKGDHTKRDLRDCLGQSQHCIPGRAAADQLQRLIPERHNSYSYPSLWRQPRISPSRPPP